MSYPPIIKNGEFDLHNISSNSYISLFYPISSSNGLTQSTSNVPNWVFNPVQTTATYIFLYDGTGPTGGHSITGLDAGYQCLVVQQSGSNNENVVVSQNLYLYSGNYTLSFRAGGRVSPYYNSGQTLNVGVSNSTITPLARTQASGISAGNWINFNQNFTVTRNGLYDISFSFIKPSTINNDTSTYLTSIHLTHSIYNTIGQICNYKFDVLDASNNIQNNYNSIYDLSLVKVGAPLSNITQTTSTISGVSVYSLNQPTTSLTDYYYYVNNSSAISGLNQNFTVSYWYYNDTTNTQYTGLFWAISNADYSKNITCSKYYVNGQYKTAISIGTNFYIGTNSISTSGWVNDVVICSYNSTTNNTSIIFYRNNVLDTFNTSTYSNGTSGIITYNGNTININGRTLFGGSTDLSFYFLGGPSSARMAFYETNQGSTGFNGLISQLNIYNTATFGSNVSYLYNSVINQITINPTPTPGIPTTGLVMYYPFDVDTLNYATGSGVNDGSSNVVSISTNHTVNNFGSLYFPGGSNPQQRFQPPVTTLTRGGGMTFSIWAKFIRLPASNTSPNFRLFDFADGAYRSATYSIVLFYQNFAIPNYNKILVYIKGVGTNEKYLQPVPNYNGSYVTLNDQIWHHYCLTIDGNGSTNFNVKLYIDRVNVLNSSLSTTVDYPPSTTFNTCLIGQSNNTGDNTNTQPEFYVNNFMLFNRVINESEINTLYTTVASTKLASIMKFNYWGLMAYYPFNRDILNYATSSGVNDGTNSGILMDNASRYTGEKSVFLNEGNLDKGFKIRNLNLKNSGITISFWLKLASFPEYSSFPTGIASRLFYLGVDNNTANCILAFFYISKTVTATKSQCGPYINKDNTNTIDRYRLADPFTLDTNWHHYCFTISPTSYYLTTYVDGLIWEITTTQTDIGTPAVSSSTYPFNVDLTGCYIGTSKSYFGTERFNPMYVNDFMVFNRCINYSEIGTLMSFRNTVLNGNFTGFNDGTRTSLDNVNLLSQAEIEGRQYSSSVYNTLLSNVNSRVSGWNFSGTGTYAVVIYAGNGWHNNTLSVFINTNPQQYSLVVQYSTNTSGSFTAYQQIYLTKGSYILLYRAAGRSGNLFNPNTMTLTASLLQYPSENSIFSYRTPSGANYLTNDGIFRKYSQSFTITTTGLYTLNFNFNQSAINDSIIGLTGIEIDKLTQVFKKNGTDIGGQFQDLVLQTGLRGLNILPDPRLIQTTSFYNSTMFDTEFQNKTLYMFGTRNASGFEINGVDLGFYYQQDSVFDSSSGYCFALNLLVVPNQYKSNISLDAQAIWPQNNIINPLASNNSIFYWVYYTFYYSGADNSGSVVYGCDNYSTLYFNGIYISRTENNTYTDSSINIVRGLNYIRIACYNSNAGTDSATAFLIATFRDSGSNVVAVTNPNWVWSLVPSTYANTTNYNNILGALPIFVNLTLSGTRYYDQLPIDISTLITGAPSGTTYSPSQITTANGVGTYTFSDFTVNLPGGYTRGTYSGSIIVLPTVVNLTMSGTRYYDQLPINIASYITGAPVGTTYSPSQITTANGVRTYTFSDFTVNLPGGYTRGTYSGSIIVLPTVVNLTMSGTVYSNQLPINIASYITGAPSGTTYIPSQITTANGVGTYTFSNFSVTLPSGYTNGTYSGSIIVSIPTSGRITATFGINPITFEFDNNPITLASDFSMPSGYNCFNFYIFGGGGNGYNQGDGGGGGGGGGFISATSIPYSNGSNIISNITHKVAWGDEQNNNFSNITVNYSNGSSISLTARSGGSGEFSSGGIGGTTAYINNATGFYNNANITRQNGENGGSHSSSGLSSGKTSSGSGGNSYEPVTNNSSATFSITAQDGTTYTNISEGGGRNRFVSGFGSGGAGAPTIYNDNRGDLFRKGSHGVIYYTLSAT
jgi:hypothetical protein